MSLDDAISCLIGRWLKDLVRSGRSLPSELIRAQLNLLSAIAEQLANHPPKEWSDALPANGAASEFYESVVLPLQRHEGLSSEVVATRVWQEVATRRDVLHPKLMRQMREERRNSATTNRSGQQDLEMSLTLQERMRMGYFRDDWSVASRRYFGFVENIEFVLPGRLAYGPNGIPLESAPKDRPLRHVRLSAILAEQFAPIAANIDPVDPDRVTLEQRRRRGDQLRARLEGVGLPVLDILIHRRHEDLWRLRLASSSWWVVGVSGGPLSEADMKVFITDPDGISTQADQARLLLLTPVPDPSRGRLRDIFSLVHVPDADFGTTERNEGSPAPIPPPASLDDSIQTRAGQG